MQNVTQAIKFRICPMVRKIIESMPTEPFLTQDSEIWMGPAKTFENFDREIDERKIISFGHRRSSFIL